MYAYLFQNNLLDEVTGVRKTNQSLPGVDSKQVRIMRIPYSVKLWWDKTLVNGLFQSFAKENVGEFTIANISVFT